MTNVNGTLYGMISGSAGNGGGLFALKPSGSTYKYSLVHAFELPPIDGSNFFGGLQIIAFILPASPLVVDNGALYGTTYAGGAGVGCANEPPWETGCGSVFKVTP